MNQALYRNLPVLLLALFLPLFALSHTACAEPFRWLDAEGSIHTLDDYRGKAVIVHIWASWCPPCRAEMPEMSIWLHEHPGVPFLPVSVDDSAGAARNFLKQQGIELPLLLTDSREASMLGVRVLPTTFVIAANGEVKQRLFGAQSWADKDFSSTLIKALDPD